MSRRFVFDYDADEENDETDAHGIPRVEYDEPDEYGIVFERPVESPQPFAEKVKEYCKKNASDDAYIDLFVSALRGEFDFGSISSLVFNKYIASRVKENTRQESKRLKVVMQRKLELARASIKGEFAARIDTEVELRGIYQVVRDKFLSDPAFLNLAVSKILEDVKKSKDDGEYPILYEMTLQRCDQAMIAKVLAQEYADDLILRFGPAIRTELLDIHRQKLLAEIKSELLKDEQIIAEIREEIKRDLVQSMFG